MSGYAGGRLGMVWGLGILAVVALAVGQAWAAVQVTSYFPLAPGTVWTYRTNTSGEVLIRVGPPSRVGSYPCRIIETVVSGNTTQRECYRVASDGVYAHQRSYPAGSILLDPPQRVLAVPVTVGQVWQWSGRVGEHHVIFNYVWARRETAEVPAGRYDAMQLYFEGNIGPEVRIQSWRWFASGIGMIKEDSVLVNGQQTVRIYAELVRVIVGR